LLEFDGRWEPEALKDSAIPATAQNHLQNALESIPQSQVLLIRQQPRLAPEGIAFFVVIGREVNPALYAFHLDSYDDLVALDLSTIAAENAVYADHRRAAPLYVVCTHGRRDKCCARNGIPVYERLAQQVGAAIWQTSHIGGHRLSGNLIAFPHNITYGRVTPDSAAAILEADRAGQLVPAHYRGRACYSRAAQAAEYFLRMETGRTAINAFRLVETQSLDGKQWRVRFVAAEDGLTHTLHVAEESIQTFAGCGDDELGTHPQYRLLSYTAVSS
jgi:hypothetical protein